MPDLVADMVYWAFFEGYISPETLSEALKLRVSTIDVSTPKRSASSGVV